MTQRQKLAMAALAGLLVVLGVAIGTGTFDGVLRQFAGTAPPEEEAGRTDLAATPVGEPTPGDAAIAERVVPVFDLVRVEPTGDAVIAGQGTPNAEVEILSGDGVIATGKVNAAGEWAIVLTDPLKVGAHDITVRTRGPGDETLTSEQSVAVSVPEGGNGEVLVVLNQPGTPSTVLQIPGEAEADAAVAAASGDAVPAAPDAQAGETEVAAAAGGEADPAAPAEQPTPAEPTTDVAAVAPAGEAAPQPAAPADGQATPADANAEPAVVEAGDAAAPGTEAPSEAAPTDQATAPAESPVEPAPVAAEATPAELTPSTAHATPAEPAPVAEATPAEPAPVPAEATPAEAVAEAAPAEPAPAAGGTEVAAVSPAEPSEPAPAEAFAPAVPVTVEAVELENGERFFAAGAAEAGAVLRLYVDDGLAAEIRAMPSGRWLVDTDLKLEPGRHTVRADQIAPDGTVIARAEVPFEIADDLAAAPTTVSGAGSVVAGSGTAGEARIGDAETLIIRQGDNLWRIARRLYGRGVRYSTIYQANSDQIVDPDLIYPGQVFVIPKGDTAWQAEEAAAAPAGGEGAVTQ